MAGIDISQFEGKKRKVVPEKESVSILQREIRLFPSRFPDKKKEMLYQELCTLLEAGVDVRGALELIEEQQGKAKERQLMEQIREQVIAGDSLSDAFKQSGQFTAYEYVSLQIGEETGLLVEVLGQLADFYNKKLKQRRQITAALSYPVIVLGTSFTAVTFMLYFIVPMFSDVFKRFGGDLPALTQLVIDFADLFSRYFMVLLAGILGIVGVLYYYREKAWFRKVFSTLLLRLPIAGPMLKGIYQARFCTSMGLLTGAKVPLLNAMKLVGQMITFYPIESVLPEVEKDVLAGKSLNESLKRFSIFEARMIALLKVGEEVNRLPQFFKKLAQQYADETEHRTALLSSMLEPVMIIVLGIVVGFILIAMYLPMFEISTSVGM